MTSHVSIVVNIRNEPAPSLHTHNFLHYEVERRKQSRCNRLFFSEIFLAFQRNYNWNCIFSPAFHGNYIEIAGLQHPFPKCMKLLKINLPPLQKSLTSKRRPAHVSFVVDIWSHPNSSFPPLQNIMSQRDKHRADAIGLWRYVLCVSSRHTHGHRNGKLSILLFWQTYAHRCIGLLESPPGSRHRCERISNNFATSNEAMCLDLSLLPSHQGFCD